MHTEQAGAPTNVLELTDATFDEEVLASPLPVVVEVGADWCPPCQAMVPVLASVADDFAGRLRVMKVDSDHNPMVARRFDVTSIPTFLGFADGKLKLRMVGARGRNNFVENLAGLLG